MFTLVSFAVVAALALLATTLNRNDRHPAGSIALWSLAVVLFVRASLVWLARP